MLFPYSENPEINMLSLSHNKSPDRAPAGCSLISVFSEHVEYERMAVMSDEQLIAWACQQTESMYPELKGHFLFSHVGRQPRTACIPAPDDGGQLMAV